MAQIECGRGHLYDPEQYPACPYCNQGSRITIASANRTVSLSGLNNGSNFGYGKPVTESSPTMPVRGYGTPVTESSPTMPVRGYGAPVTESSPTMPVRGYGTPVTESSPTAPVRGYGTPVTESSPTAPVRGYGAPVTESSHTAPVRGYGATPPEPAPQQPAPAPRPVSVTEEHRTVGFMQSRMGFDPVVGWLACVEGPSRGKSYVICGGINTIGRSERNSIAITGDMKISAENHARISYSDKNNRFNLIPGDGRNIVYLNDEEVFAPAPLHAYDLIDFGDTKLMFVPLCGEKFQWKREEG